MHRYMEFNLATVLSILSMVFVILNFSIGRKDKSSKDSGDANYKMGALDTQIKEILKKLDKIDNKLDGYDKEIDERIQEALKHHVREYHQQVDKNGDKR